MSKRTFRILFQLLLTVYSFNACTHSRKPLNAREPLVSTKSEVKKTDDVDDHFLAEINESDAEIEKVVGHELDKDLDNASGSKKYNFLKRVHTKRVEFWIDYFANKQHDRFQRFINNGESYRKEIEKILTERGVPKELYFVGLIESGYNLGAKSHASAVGPWQFIRGTGARYGLKMSKEIDERRDLFKATQAAADYFKDLHNIFMSWELALSAYNAGEYGIVRRITQHNTRDFYELSNNQKLPAETINYVPKVLAAMHIVENAKKYGFHIPSNHGIYQNTKKIAVEKNTSLTVLARKLNVPATVLGKLNPELLANKTPRNFYGSYYLRVPSQNYSYVAPQNDEYRETLMERIANIDVEKMKKKNKRERERRVASVKTKPTAKPIVYKVSSGDTLKSIASTFNIPMKKLVTSNKIKSTAKVQVGQKIILPNTKKGTYTVKAGDHLTKIAQKYNLSKTALVKLNALKQKKIYPGQKLLVNLE